MFCIFCILYIFTCCADHLKPGSDAYFTYFAYFAHFTYFTLCCASRCVPAQRSVAIDVRMCSSSRKSFGKSFGKSFEKSFDFRGVFRELLLELIPEVFQSLFIT